MDFDPAVLEMVGNLGVGGFALYLMYRLLNNFIEKLGIKLERMAVSQEGMAKNVRLLSDNVTTCVEQMKKTIDKSNEVLQAQIEVCYEQRRHIEIIKQNCPARVANGSMQ